MDNGPEISSHKFRSFSKFWDILDTTISSHYRQSNGLGERSIQTVKRTLNKAKRNSEDHFIAMLSLNSQPDQNGTSSAKTLFGHNLRTTLPSLIPSTWSTGTEKHTVTRNLRRKMPEIVSEQQCELEPTNKTHGQKRYRCESKWSHTIVRYFEEERKYFSQKPSSPDTNNRKFNIEQDYGNAIPVCNTYNHPHLMIDNQHEKPTLEDVYRTKSGRIVQKLKPYIDEMWYDLFLTSGHIINKRKQYVNEMWHDLFDKAMYWTNVIWYYFKNFLCFRDNKYLGWLQDYFSFFIYLRRWMLIFA